MLGRTCALLALFLATTTLSACVTLVYHPLGAIRQPLAIEFSENNFKDFSIRLICEAGPLLTSQEANMLCGNLSAHFEAQGARVLVGPNDSGEDAESEVPASEADGSAEKTVQDKLTESSAPTKNSSDRKIQLTAQLSAKRVRHERHGWLGILFYYSLSLIPIVEEFTDEQRVVIRGKDGIVLKDETFQMRFIEYTGLGYLALNALANVLFRSDKEQINEQAAGRQMTSDLRAQMSQLILNAGMRQQSILMQSAQNMGSK
jgi:hypothetical protein